MNKQRDSKSQTIKTWSVDKQKFVERVAVIRQSERDRRNRIENDDKEQTVQLKKGICRWVQWVVTLYLAFVSCLILAVAWEQLALNDAVIITLLSTTTINILALPYIIINSLFPK